MIKVLDGIRIKLQLIFRAGAPAIGKVLICTDSLGTVAWGTVPGGNSVINTAVTTNNIQSNSFMNTNYGTYSIGDQLVFTNLSDAPSNTAVVIKISSTTWSNRIDYVKNT